MVIFSSFWFFVNRLLSEADNSYKRCQDDLNSIAEMVDNTCKEVTTTIYETLPTKTSVRRLRNVNHKEYCSHL